MTCTPGKAVGFELLWLDVLLGVVLAWGLLVVVACGLDLCTVYLTVAHYEKSNFLSICKVETQII